MLIQLLYELFAGAFESGKSMGVCNLGKFYPSMYQKFTGGRFMIFVRNLSKLTEFYYLEPDPYSSVTDIIDAMNTPIQERYKHNRSCLPLKVSRRMETNEIYLANFRSGRAFSKVDLGHIFGSIVGCIFGVMLRGKGPHKPVLSYDIARIHSLVINTI